MPARPRRDAAGTAGPTDFNEREGTPRPAVFGAVTTVNIWRFLKLGGTALSIDAAEYYSGDVGKILGILQAIAGD